MINSRLHKPFKIFSMIVAAGLVGVSGTEGLAQTTSEIVVQGTPVTLESTSIKCELGETEGVSKKRLVGCDSAQLIEVSHGDLSVRAVEFRINPKDKQISSGVRAELRDMHESVNGDETWYRFATLLPSDFPIEAKHRLVVSQWHERIFEGGESLRPPLSHRLWDGRFVVTLWNQDRVDERGIEGDGEILFEIPELKRGVFHEFVYKIKWSSDADGEILAWLRECALAEPNCPNGTWKQIIRYKGSTGYDSDKAKSYYFKFGLYTVTDFDVPFTAFHKGYKRGASAAEVDAVDVVLQ